MQPTYLRVVSYLICSCLIMAAVYLRLDIRLSVAQGDARRARREVILFRSLIGLFVLVALSIVCFFALPRLDSKFLAPGLLIFFSFYSDTGYVSPVLTGFMCLALLSGAVLILRRANSGNARRSRALAACILALIPLIPYGVVEGQTMIFGGQFTDFLRHEGLIDSGKLRVFSIGPTSAVVAVDDFCGDLFVMRRSHGRWHIENSKGIRGEYIGPFPPYPGLE